MFSTLRLDAADPTAPPPVPAPRGRWDLAFARAGARLIHPLRYEYGGLAWTVVILLAVIGAGGPVVAEKNDDAALAACVQRSSVGQCKAAGADVALDNLHGVFAGTTTPSQARGPSDLGLVPTRVEALTGDEEAVLLVLGQGDDASSLLGALVADGAVRLGTGTYTLPSSPWRVYPLDMTWREARALPPTSTPWTATIATLLMLGGPIPLCWLVTQAIVRPLRDGAHRASTYALLRTLRDVAGAVAGLGLLGSFALGSVRMVVLVDWLYRRFLTSTPKVWDVEEMYVLAGMLIVTFFGTLAYGALELICWPDELEDLSVILRRPYRDITPSALISDAPDAAADADTAFGSAASESRPEASAHDEADSPETQGEALRRGAGPPPPQDTEALQASQFEQLRDTASRHASLADRELLRIIDAWPAEQPGVGVLLPLGIHPPPVPWTQLAEDGTPGEADDAWGAHLGRAHTPTKPKTSGEDEQERARDQRKAAITLRMDTARFQRVQALQRLVALQYIRMMPDRIELMPLGRSILALPPMALVDDIPFDVQRDLAVAEDLLGQGQAVGAIQKNAVFLESYLKKLLLAFAPASLEAPAWKRAEANQAPFWRIWLDLFRSGERAPSFRANFLAELDSVVRQRLHDAAATLPDEVVRGLDLRRSPPVETLGLVLQGVKVLGTADPNILRGYLVASGVPAAKDMQDAARGAVYGALSKLDRRKVDAAYATWHARFPESIADCTLGTLVHTTAALLPVLLSEGEAAGRHAHLLDGHTLLVHNAGIRIRELRNATMHHREQVALSDAKTIRMAEHMLWLTRIFVTSVEAAREGTAAAKRT